MPKKYSIHPHLVPPRFRPIGMLGIVDWREDCSSCHNCVKRNCVYDLYAEENEVLHDEFGFLDYIYQCKGCLVCIQNCTKNILTRVVNPEYKLLGDSYFTPDIILSTWYQSETGRIPVSGSGYGGKFSGEGFDSMWTDMSEIVRPTRDGIHGREYINTGVDIGRKLKSLAFKAYQMTQDPPPRIESPVPLLFDIIPEKWQRGPVLHSIIKAGKGMGLYTIVRCKNITDNISIENDNIVPFMEDESDMNIDHIKNAKMIMIPYSEHVLKTKDLLKKNNINQIVAIRIAANPDVSGTIVALAKNGAEVIHLVCDNHGYETGSENPRHLRDVLRDVHTTLVKEGIRDQITLTASGGIAMAEHMAKAIICGADLIAIDIPLLIALECRLCMECHRGEHCQIELDKIHTDYAVNRITNLVCAWRNQLLELLGAMGIREVRRLRGETGRCMFFEDLEKDTFGILFGERKDAKGAATL